MRRAQAPRGCATKPVRPAGADHPHFAQLRGYAMRTFDLAPLYRSTVGFDRLFSMLDGFEAAPGYPPYNIERTGENAYRFFFQAEDGIRDLIVTGVQTCALPI